MPQYNITSGLPQLPNAPENLFPYLLPIYQSINALTKPIASLTGQVTFDQVELAERSAVASINSQHQNRLFAKALVDLPFGALVNLKLDSGALAAQLADATDLTKPAHGIVANTQGIDTGQYGEITMMQGHSYGISGTTIGAFYWLSTGGLVQNTPPVAPGSLVQGVGVGLGSLGFFLSISSQITAA